MHASTIEAEITRRMTEGATLDEVDRELIQPSGLASEMQAALWLLAWSFTPITAQRQFAIETLRVLSG